MHVNRYFAHVIVTCVAASACSSTNGGGDSGATERDAVVEHDSEADAPGPDSSTMRDSTADGTSSDATELDSGVSESGSSDGSIVDSGPAAVCMASGGTVTSQMCCQVVGDFPDLCVVGACGCSPSNSHAVRVCDCGAGKCWDGIACTDRG